MNVNKVILIGRIGRDPETRDFGSNNLAEFSLATSKSWKSGDEWKERTEWHNVKAWNKLADKVAKYAKGQLVFVEGELETEEWEKDGQTRRKTVINARQVQLLEKKAEIATEYREPFANNGAGNGGDNLPF